MDYLWAFVIGGLICVVGQILIDKTRLTPARILVAFVVAGCALEFLGWYGPLAEFAGAGATVPISGFGYSLAKGVKEGIEELGFLGVLAGGITGSSAGIAAAIFFGYLMAMAFKPQQK